MAFDPSKLSLPGQVNYQAIQAGIPVYHAMQEMAEKPMEYNTKLLMQLLQDNKDTEYGKKYDFAHIHSVADFQKKVPVTQYADYEDYIMRMTEDGAANLITSYPICHYCKSSGTMGTPKRIPMSDRALDIYYQYNAQYMNALLAHEMGMDWFDGRSLALTESAPSVPTLKCGTTYCALSVKVALKNRSYIPYMCSSPDEAMYPVPNTNTRYIHARFALMDPGLYTLGGSFSSFLLELLRYIEKKWEMLVKDIELGVIDAAVKMPDKVRASLMSKLQPMPERAAELRAIFRQGFEEPFIPKVWPKVRYLASVATADFKGYADRIMQRYAGSQIHYYKLGLNASEGIFSVPTALDSDDSALIPNSLFYEFLPLDAGDDFSRIVTMDQVEVGKDYELIATNLSGFYRYRMRDAVRITGRYKNLPTIQFLYRIDRTVSITGEKTTEVALRYAAEQTARDLDFELVDFSVYPDTEAVPMRYTYFMELGKTPPDLRPKEIRHVLEHNLAVANPSMGAKVQAGICGPTKLNILAPETYLLYYDLMIMRGAASGQIKPVHIIANEAQRKFFFELTEYSIEVQK